MDLSYVFWVGSSVRSIYRSYETGTNSTVPERWFDSPFGLELCFLGWAICWAICPQRILTHMEQATTVLYPNGSLILPFGPELRFFGWSICQQRILTHMEQVQTALYPNSGLIHPFGPE